MYYFLKNINLESLTIYTPSEASEIETISTFRQSIKKWSIFRYSIIISIFITFINIDLLSLKYINFTIT